VIVAAVACGACSSGSGSADATSTTDAPSAEERAVCDRLQDVVDALGDQDRNAMLAGLDGLEQAVSGTANSTLTTDGQEFFATINGTVPNSGDMTIEESAAVGDAALRRAQPALDGLISECAALGLPMQGLPTAADRP
jgi:hypothetical protein